MAEPFNPVLGSITRDESLSDPALRELYFGSSDTPGLINQATRAAQKSYLDQPAILQGTAGLSNYEQQARQLAQQGLGSYQPFLNRQEGLINQGISDLGQQRGLLGEALGGYRSAYGMQQPYFGAAESQLGAGLGGMFSSLGYGGPSARNLLGQSLQGYDPRMANQFYNPFEEQVVNRTIQDVLKAGDIQDIQQRAADISRGGESAFGSRARLSSAERQSALGRGLGEALSQIRSGGFDTAQSRALQELENRRSGARSGATLEAGFGAQGLDAQRQYAQDLLGLGQGRSSAARQLAGDISGVGSGIAGIGANLAGYGSSLGQLGETQQRLRGQDISMLEGLGSVDRGIEQQRLNNQYNQEYATRMAPTQAASYIQGFAPQYQGSRTDIKKQYGMPPDPYKDAMSTALGTYASLAPKQQQQPTYNVYSQPQQQSGGMMNTGYQQPQANFGMQQPQQGQFFNAAQGYQAFQPQGSQQGLAAYMPPPPASVAPQMPQQGIYGAPQAYTGTYA
tara:strand:+ start:698 stop:2224 length:1527 start_codon:yes stop_codon:yes gene_type:complete